MSKQKVPDNAIPSEKMTGRERMRHRAAKDAVARYEATRVGTRPATRTPAGAREVPSAPGPMFDGHWRTNASADGDAGGHAMAFRCADVGYPHCNWHVEGESAGELLPQIQKHAAEVHRLALKNLSRQRIERAIRTAM